MEPRSQVDGQALCPNCHERVPDTTISYEETVFSEMQASEDTSYVEMRARHYGPRMERRSQSSVVRSGTVTLCSTCAKRYQRYVRLRTVGIRVMNIGAVGMIVFALIYAVILPARVQASGAGLATGALVGLGALAVAMGAVMYISGRAKRRSATRFISKLHG